MPAFAVGEGRKRSTVLWDARDKLDKMHKLLLVRNVKNKKIKMKNEQSVHATGRAMILGKTKRKSRKN